MTKPFSESACFEQGNATDAFYATGSNGSIGENPGSFSRSLFNKEQIKLSFAVTSRTTMLPNSCSIYYFNRTSGTWNIPSKAAGDHVGPFNKFAVSTNWYPTSGTTGYGYTRGTTLLEDAKAFDAYGRAVASGSLEIYRQAVDYDADGLGVFNNSSRYAGSSIKGNEIGKSIYYRGVSVIDALIDDFSNSVQRASIYEATRDETFELNIDQPFLLEKAVFELPFCFGSSWFQDRTVTSLSVSTGTYTPTGRSFAPWLYTDTGGPAVTVSLFCQKNYGQTSIRDLIAKGTITHSEDAKLTAVARRLGIVERGAYGVAVEPFGLRNPNATVRQTSASSAVTSSVIVKTAAAVTNGVNGLTAAIWFMTSSLEDSGTDAYKQPGYEVYYKRELLTKYKEIVKDPDLYGKTEFPLSSFAALQTSVVSTIDPIGRGMTGFSPSGGSIFGGEYASSQAFSKNGDPIVLNPYYSDNSTSSDRITAYNNLESFFNQLGTDIQTYVPNYNGVPANLPYPGIFRPQAWIYNIFPAEVFSATKESPYLINPGDKLVLMISKTRPAISASGHDVRSDVDANTGKNILTKLVPITGSVSGHDIQLNSGSINMTFYGSYVRAGDSYTP